jgi:hypothetical protein
MACHSSALRVRLTPNGLSNVPRTSRLHCILAGLERCVDLLLCRIQHATGRLLH